MVSFDNKNKFSAERADMVRTQLMARDITDPAVLEVMGKIPREQFVPPKYTHQAYADCPVPIGMGQTISQPYIVALMTQLLRLNSSCTVLEIGTGCGYQTAILAKLTRTVYTVERLNQLSETAQTNLADLGLENIEFYIGDGSKGWCRDMQFDRIIITAAVPDIPEIIIGQLRLNGLAVAPVGGEYSQELIVYEKTKTGLSKKTACGCRFVKLIGKYGFNETQ
jgi:protein-L-isoaspartate(D-aspartate) O-methyltransferase